MEQPSLVEWRAWGKQNISFGKLGYSDPCYPKLPRPFPCLCFLYSGQITKNRGLISAASSWQWTPLPGKGVCVVSLSYQSKYSRNANCRLQDSGFSSPFLQLILQPFLEYVSASCSSFPECETQIAQYCLYQTKNRRYLMFFKYFEQ